VTSVIILLESGRQNVFTLLYRELRDDSNANTTLIELYEAWNKPEKVKELRTKLPQTEAVNEWQNAFKMTQFYLAKPLQPKYNSTTRYLPIFLDTPFVSALKTVACERPKFVFVLH